ncbi:hypothetical protein GCM10023189_11570 [Nibrella saemangeumensis]|uniref:Metal-sensitive transcriptional regulator n=1 Tax=Nibrella saemangeumensis TaxID=1084526 RepID=A0ABP8MKE8_9BACT
MLPKDLTLDLRNRLNYLAGQLQGIVRMLDQENTHPEQILIQFKSLKVGLQKAHVILMDEVVRKDLALRIVDLKNACPGNCPDAENIESVRQEFPYLKPEELIDTINEVDQIRERLARYNARNQQKSL